ncbi:hypothetical protein ASPBRDRAFT_129026, partial [Aspergillus brasiliensis CBS 101740]
IASGQLFHLALLAQLCVGFKHSGNANPILFADKSPCMYVHVLRGLKRFCFWGHGGLRSSPDWHIRAQSPPPRPSSFPPKPHQAIILIKAFCIELRRLLHTKAARNPVPGRLMSCCSPSF